MNKRRLLKLADLLEADAKNKKGMRFDLEEVLESKEAIPEWNCATVGCAIGLAMVSKAFERSGLGMKSVTHPWGTFIEPTFDSLTGFGIADSAFFDLSSDEHNFLFCPNGYEGEQRGKRGELHVAKRVRDFVAGKVAPPAE